MSEVKEIRALTGLRGLAAVYVVLFHISIGLGFSSMPRTFLSHGYLAVDLFFVLSGFVMTLNYAELFRERYQWKSMWLFLTRRIARVYPLYFVTLSCAIILISCGLLEGRHQAPADYIKSILANVFMVQSWGFGESFNGPSWSISAEWAAYLLFPLALSLARDLYSLTTKTSILAALLWIGACCWLPSNITHRPYPEAMIDLHSSGGWPVFRCLPEFFLGIVAARVYTQSSRTAHSLGGWTGDCMSIVILLALMLRWSDFFFVLLCPLLILSMTSKDGIFVRFASSGPVRHLGILSYSIYLVHDLLRGIVGSLHRLANSHGLRHGQTYGAVAALALIYPLSLLAYNFVEKPFRQIVRSLFERKDKKLPAPIGPLGIDLTN